MVAGSAGKALGIPVVANIHNYINIKYYRHIQHLFPGTHDQERYLISKGIDHGNITVIPHFSRVPAIERMPSVRFETSSPLFISLGRFVPKKGFHILIEAIKRLHEEGIAARLVLGGDGPEKERLQKLAADLGISEHVRFHGWVDDIADFLSQSDIFVLPSLDEPFGIVILEAMALGKVIVSTLTKGPREVLDNTCAYCCEPGDAISMSARLKEVLENREAAEQKAIIAWNRYTKNYSAEVVIPRFEEVYNSIG
jgi:glycosyltransferase involved in cell wall biosynthesis